MATIYAVSDIHTDYAANLDWANDIQSADDDNVSVLIVAGDVTDDIALLIETFSILTDRFDLVCFVPGNHDCWVNEKKSPAEDSFDRVTSTRQRLRDELGVAIGPVSIKVTANDDASHSTSIALIPLLAWHHESFDPEPEIPSSEVGGRPFPAIKNVVSDRSRCKWPIPLFLEERNRADSKADASDSVEYFRLLARFAMHEQPNFEQHIATDDWQNELIAWRLDNMNDTDPLLSSSFEPRKFVRAGCHVEIRDESEWLKTRMKGDTHSKHEHIVSFSHFLPFPFLNPEKRFLFYPYLSKVIGSKYLGMRLLRLRSDIHIFGHTHFGWNCTLGELLDNQASKAGDNWSEELRKMRFVQAPLGYPRERSIRLRSLSVGAFNRHAETPQLCRLMKVDTPGLPAAQTDPGPAYWSTFYCKEAARDGSNTTVASYVRDIYKRMQ